MLRSASPLASSLLRAARPLAVLPTQPIIHPSASASYPRAAAMLSSSTSDHAQRATATAALAGADNKAPAGSPGPSLRSLEDLTFDNTFTAELPGEAEENRVRQVHGAFYSYVTPTPTGTEPTTIIASREVADLIGLDPSELDRPEFALIFSGNAPLPSAKPYAQCYGGHQFGSWAGQLGDGRAICLGEVLNQQTGLRWELQMKGAGRTPYSRMADGRAVLRSSLREYVASEAMAALGVPTTRALSLVATGDQVLRDMFYNGNARLEPGAVVCRVARSFIRFGTFQLPASRGEDQAPMVRQLADYVIRHFYPECDPDSPGFKRTVIAQGGEGTSNGANTEGENGGAAANGAASVSGPNKYAEFLAAVARRTGFLVSEWNRVGFVHGVLNTDNMSILGDTIDYGPYGWIERFDPDFTPNTTDLPGRRYAFHAQPEVGQWNILQLARALLSTSLLTEEEAREGLRAYGVALTEAYHSSMAKKMGLKSFDPELTQDLTKEMYNDAADYTNTFRALSAVRAEPSTPGADDEMPAELAAALGPLEGERAAAWGAWLRRYRNALRAAGWASEDERRSVQDMANPAIIPRNHVLVGIIGEAEAGNYAPLERYMAAVQNPYSAEGLDPAWCEPGPKQVRLGVELLSCSS